MFVHLGVFDHIQTLQLDNDEDDERLTQELTEQTMSILNRYLRHGEALTIEVDTDSDTCVVLPVRSTE